MTPVNPTVSIITVTHNSQRYIAAMLESVFAQRISATFEVIVVDNGSSDGTAAFIEENYPQVKLVRSTNTGFGQGNNLAVQHANGDYLAFINPDTELDTHCIEALVRPLPETNVVTTAKILLQCERSSINTCGNQIHFSAYGFVQGYGECSEAYPEAETVDGISGAAFALRRADFDRLGRFDESLFLYCEDTELSWRCRRDGMRILLVPDSIVYHDYDLLLTPQKIYFLEYGRWSILKKYYTLKDWLLLWPSLLVADLLAWTYALRFGVAGLKMKLAGTVDALKNPATPFPTQEKVNVVAGSRECIPFATVTRNRAVLLTGGILNAFFWLNFRVYKLLS